ncbi:hypothetical protein F5B20DRAFT_50753 [Whalleya microplaca]|nr:hypothetical protein F5B20DRAFT_50753 [Whalleya microplaca]
MATSIFLHINNIHYLGSICEESLRRETREGGKLRVEKSVKERVCKGKRVRRGPLHPRSSNQRTINRNPDLEIPSAQPSSRPQQARQSLHHIIVPRVSLLPRVQMPLRPAAEQSPRRAGVLGVPDQEAVLAQRLGHGPLAGRAVAPRVEYEEDFRQRRERPHHAQVGRIVGAVAVGDELDDPGLRYAYGRVLDLPRPPAEFQDAEDVFVYGLLG